MAEFDGVSDYLKSAPRRLQDALELLQTPTLHPYRSDAETRHLRGAVYLAGYAVEAVLKAYILTRLNVQSVEQAIAKAPASKKSALKKLNTAAGHSLAFLISLTDIEKDLDTHISWKKDWGLCLKWKSTWRYNPQPISREDAREFIEAISRVYEWVRNRL